jgi:hypothetical protein
MLKTKIILALLMFTAGTPPRARAANSPQKIGFQGKLLDTANNPRNGSFDMTFRIFDLPAAGAELWTETQTGVAVNNGVFTVQLGAATALPAGLFNGASAYLEVEVAPDTAMTPRQQLLMSPYAFRALLADDLVTGNTNYVQVRATLQAGAVFHVASGTVAGQFLATGASSFTASGNSTYSLNTSSGIRLQAGTLRVEGSGGVEVLTTVRAATVTAATAIVLPQGAASSVEGAMRWEPTQNQLFIGTGTANKTIADTDSVQTLTNKTLNSTGGNTVDATHLRTRLLASDAPDDGMTIKWDAGAGQWAPAHVATITVIATPFTPAANSAITADFIYLTPIIIPGRLLLNQIRYRVTTARAGVTGDVGLYDTSGSLIASGGANSASFTIAQAWAVNVVGAPVIIQPGQYYLAITCSDPAASGNPSVRASNLLAASAGVVKGMGTFALAAGAGTTLPAGIVLGQVVDGFLAPFMSLNE